MGTPRPKYIANRPFRVARKSFDIGDPVPGGRALELGLTFGYVDSTAKGSKTDTDPPTPESADNKETP